MTLIRTSLFPFQAVLVSWLSVLVFFPRACLFWLVLAGAVLVGIAVFGLF
jgi:hypothetical protein